MTTEEKRQRIDPDHPILSVRLQCELLGLPRSSYYYQARESDVEDEQLMQLIDAHYLQYPHEGARKIALMLAQNGYSVSRYRVGQLLKAMGLEPLYPKPNTSVPDKQHKVYAYLLKDIDIIRPNQVWCADITYIPLLGSHVYLVAIMDWYSRYVIEWEISISLESAFCVAALKRALAHQRCEIFNTDQGAQFTSRAWIDLLASHHISISMDGRGR